MTHPTLEQRHRLDDGVVIEHLERCATCRGSLEVDVDLDAVRSQLLDQLATPVVGGERQRPSRRRRWRPLVAAAAVMLQVGIVAVLLGGGPIPDSSFTATDSGPMVEGPTPSPVEVARAFMEARNAWDADGLQDLLAAGAVINEDFVDSADDYPAVVAFERATGWQHVVEDCYDVTDTEAGEEGEAVVICSYLPENDWSRAIELSWFSIDTFRLVIAEGQIVAIDHNANEHHFFSRAWFDFVSWLEEAHPDDVPVMLQDLPPTPVEELSNQLHSGAELTPIRRYTPHLTPEAIALYDRYTDEFVEAVASR